AKTLQDVGSVYSDMGEMQKALGYYNQALPLLQAADDKRQVAVALNNIGTAYRELGQPQKAMEYYNQSLTLRRAVGDRLGEAATLNNLGQIYGALSERQRSLESYSQALALAQGVGDRRTEAYVLKNIAFLRRDQGNLTEAHSNIERAISLLEFIRTRAGDQENRASFLAAVSDYHEFYIDLLMRMHVADPQAGHNLVALTVSEQARARSLLELLVEAHTDVREGVDTKLLERERSLEQRITIKLDNLTKLLSGKHTDAQKAAAEKEIDGLTDEYRQAQIEIRQRSPRYAALTQPQTLGTKEIQQQMLDDDTILLEYALGRDHSYLWAVTTDRVLSYQLPSRVEIESAARRAYQLLVARQPAPGLTEAQQRARATEADAQYQAQAAALSQMLLGPVAAQLGTKRLLIVADGALQYLPFATLPVPAGQVPENSNASQSLTSSPRPPLVLEHEIVSLPSASVLALLRGELAGRQPATKSVAVLADPVFNDDDARVKLSRASRKSPAVARHQTAATTPSASPSSTALERSISSVRGSNGDRASLRRLLFSRDEAEAILTVTSQPSSLKALDFRANRRLAMSDELGQYRVIHFATHGLLDSRHPELSGLVLSLIDEAGRPQDGFLRLHEIYNMRLNADLVVLSACQTGLGKEIRGEGLIGLTRGFMYAGSTRVMASLWQVDDAATAELMKRFYRGMMRERLTPAAALRTAQLEMMKKKHWQSPYYWGAFVLQGEWR
ncbi:MAG: CHAT domain-containing protein, partial [Pyrinomonadaceae bacterium]|nr:CHAT domain-containing protein [Pyrinomonadaceae bacterium]